MIDERIENLISRRLDGELSDEESLELNKALLRNPAARRFFNEQTAFDRLAGETLREVFGSVRHQPNNREFATHLATSSRVWGWGRRLIAVAAMLVVVAGIGWWILPFAENSHDTRPVPSGLSPITRNVDHQTLYPLADHQPVEAALLSDGGVSHAVRWPSTRHINHNVLRDAVGFYDNRTGSLLVLERDQSRTKIVPVVASY